MSDRSGQSLGTYRLVRLLGQGGFAEVYQGQHIHLNTRAALKILLSTKLQDEAEIESFRREAQTIANLTHPHIVRVLDFNIEQGVPFFVMEYAAQGSLRTKHPRGTKLPLSTVITYTHQVAAALQYAHEHRQIHRDVKPENILVRDDGSLMLSDFGIATIAHSSASQRTEDMIGTVMYMAPEQTLGRPHPNSDQYALAIASYEWLAGNHPFRGTTIEIAMQHATAAPPPLLPQAPELPATVQQVLFKALAKEPKERFATIQEFATALQEAARGLAPSYGLTPTLPASDRPNPVGRVRQAELPPMPAQSAPANAAFALPPPAMPISAPFASTGGSVANYPSGSLASSPYEQVSGYSSDSYAPPPPPPPQYPAASGYQSNPYAPPQVNVYTSTSSGYQTLTGYPPVSPQYQQPYQNYAFQAGLYNTAHPLGPTSLSISPTAAAGLSYLFSWVTGLIFFLSEKQNRFVRFHALQSIFFSIAFIIYYFMYSIITSVISAASTSYDLYGVPTYGPAYQIVSGLGALLLLGWCIIWLISMLSAFQGKYLKLPLIGNFAERIVNRHKAS